MRIVRTRNYDHMSRQAANIISAQVILKPDSVLGLATGSSPIGTYRTLIHWYEKGDLDFSEVKTVNLDEYCGLDITSDQSYVYFMHHNFFDHVNVNPAAIHLPDGKEPDEAKACGAYDHILKAVGRIDLQLLGLGPNGHIGFNEPSDHFIKGTHRVALSAATIEANKRFFASADDVPKFAYTMGILDIMHAERIVMVASGKNKARAVKEAFTGPVTPQVPASILQLHQNFTLVADEDALSELDAEEVTY